MLISRVIMPVVDQHVPFIGDGSQSGIGDITGEFFFTPATPGPNVGKKNSRSALASTPAVRGGGGPFG